MPRILIRRWYVVLVGLVLISGLIWGASVAVPASYEARAAVLLLPPPSADNSNPYLGLGGMSGVTEVLARSVSDSATADSLKALGLAGSYTAAPDQTTSAPIVLVVADAKTPAAALSLMKAVNDLLPPTLSRLQKNIAVPSKDVVSTKMLTVDTNPTVIRKSQTRAMLAAGAAGVVITLLLAAAAEFWARRRTARRGAVVLTEPEMTGDPAKLDSIAATTGNANELGRAFAFEPAYDLAPSADVPARRSSRRKGGRVPPPPGPRGDLIDQRDVSSVTAVDAERPIESTQGSGAGNRTPGSVDVPHGGESDPMADWGLVYERNDDARPIRRTVARTWR